MESITPRTEGQEKAFRRLVEDSASHGAELALNKIVVDKEGWQRVLMNGDEIRTAVAEVIVTKACELAMVNQYAAEETKSSYEYPPEYKGPKLIGAQINELATIFDLDPSNAFRFTTEKHPEIPEGAEGWFAIPSVDALALKFFPEVTDPAEKYCRAILLLYEKLGASRMFQNYREGQIDKNHLRMHARTVNALAIIQETQKCDILIIAAQLGMGHRGRSTRRAREVFVTNEYGLGSLMGCSIALTHPERFVRSAELDMDLPGDEFSPDGDGRFGKAPILSFSDGRLRFYAHDCDHFHDYCGSASGFLPQ